MVDKDVQTPVHFIEKNLDPNYCWNEWELRRKVFIFSTIHRQYKWQILEKDKQKHHKLFSVISKLIAK